MPCETSRDCSNRFTKTGWECHYASRFGDCFSGAFNRDLLGGCSSTHQPKGTCKGNRSPKHPHPVDLPIRIRKEGMHASIFECEREGGPTGRAALAKMDDTRFWPTAEAAPSSSSSSSSSPRASAKQGFCCCAAAAAVLVIAESRAALFVCHMQTERGRRRRVVH